MIHDLSESVLAFRINGISNSLPSPSNLRTWGVKAEGRCALCNKRNATTAHILSNCYTALTQNRYTWRHDNVLISIHKDILGLIRNINRRNALRRNRPPLQRFVKQGELKSHRKSFTSILDVNNSCDWHVNFDFPEIPRFLIILLLTPYNALM